MKRRSLILLSACIVTSVIISVILSPITHTANAAKWLEVCRLCRGTGDYHCETCDNTGKVTCDGCQGSGVWICDGEEGKGKCDNGYYICPSCNGDTYLRSGDGVIPPDALPGTCSTCNGKGRIECWHCHGTGGGVCDRCNGTGKSECQVGTCQVSRQYNWHCPNCKGTGYILTGNPMPPLENNDGVRNIPEVGDMIFTDMNGTYYIYGGNQSGKVTTDTDNNKETQSETTKQTKTQSEDTTKQLEDVVPVDLSVLPSDRNTDYDIIGQEDVTSDINATVRIDMGRMNSDELRIYTTLGENELAGILTNVKNIVSSAEPGRSDLKTDKMLETIAENNGFDNLGDGRMYPIYFEGHQEIGFPVKVSVSLKKGELGGGTPIYIYHIADSGEIEDLGVADVITYDDGSVEQIAFYTSSFSTFFTASKELNLEVSSDSDDNDSTVSGKQANAGEKEKPEKAEVKEKSSYGDNSSVRTVISIIVVGFAAVAVGIVLFARKRKK